MNDPELFIPIKKYREERRFKVGHGTAQSQQKALKLDGQKSSL